MLGVCLIPLQIKVLLYYGIMSLRFIFANQNGHLVLALNS